MSSFIDPADSLDPAPSVTVHLTALGHSAWQGLQSDMVFALQNRGLTHLAAPLTLILHDLLDSAIKALHRQVFRRICEHDFDLDLDGNDDHLDALYNTETNEHGSQNIARFCKANAWHVSVTFPAQADVLVWVDIPVAWDRSTCQTERLIEAVGHRLEAIPLPDVADGQRLALLKRSDTPAILQSPDLLDERSAATSFGRIFEKLGYGLIHFSAIGEIVAVSPAMLACLRLDVQTTSVAALAEAIPMSFYNDIVWGLALGEGGGVFENYRIRVSLPGAPKMSILFNVSGFRDDDAAIRSLWQAVSLDEAGTRLSEGSILSEVRIHNITRNYVPQLVEEKARDAIRLGKTELTNEERYVAVLFCDIVGFTSYVESNASSESVMDTLNSILRRVAGSVKRYHGSIDKYMGDCVMALFDDPADAIFAACDMQSHSEDINNLRLRAGQQTLQLRIGIHWGEVVIGNVGTVERLDWTAIGDVVNTASRIEKSCTPNGILISQTMRNAIAPERLAQFEFGEIFRLHVKGKWDDLAVCHVALAPLNFDLA